MTQPLEQQPTISPADLFKAAETAARTGHQQIIRLHGTALAIMPVGEAKPVHHAKPRRGKRRQNAFLAASGILPPLIPPRDINEMTEIAAEEAARADFGPHDYS